MPAGVCPSVDLSTSQSFDFGQCLIPEDQTTYDADVRHSIRNPLDGTKIESFLRSLRADGQTYSELSAIDNLDKAIQKIHEQLVDLRRCSLSEPDRASAVEQELRKYYNDRATVVVQALSKQTATTLSGNRTTVFPKNSISSQDGGQEVADVAFTDAGGKLQALPDFRPKTVSFALPGEAGESSARDLSNQWLSPRERAARSKASNRRPGRLSSIFAGRLKAFSRHSVSARSRTHRTRTIDRAGNQVMQAAGNERLNGDLKAAAALLAVVRSTVKYNSGNAASRAMCADFAAWARKEKVHDILEAIVDFVDLRAEPSDKMLQLASCLRLGNLKAEDRLGQRAEGVRRPDNRKPVHRGVHGRFMRGLRRHVPLIGSQASLERRSLSVSTQGQSLRSWMEPDRETWFTGAPVAKSTKSSPLEDERDEIETVLNIEMSRASLLKHIANQPEAVQFLFSLKDRRVTKNIQELQKIAGGTGMFPDPEVTWRELRAAMPMAVMDAKWNDVKVNDNFWKFMRGASQSGTARNLFHRRRMGFLHWRNQLERHITHAYNRVDDLSEEIEEIEAEIAKQDSQQAAWEAGQEERSVPVEV